MAMEEVEKGVVFVGAEEMAVENSEDTMAAQTAAVVACKVVAGVEH